METKTLFILTSVEALALAVGVALCYFGIVAWYTVPAFLLVPPILLIVALFVGFMLASEDGNNPFQ